MRFDSCAVRVLALVALSHFHLGWQKSSSYSFALAQEAAATETIVQVEGATFVPPENAEHYKFEAEVSRMLDIVVNSLYQNKDVFLRELISNASDALDKIRFLSLTMPELLEGEDKLQVQIEYDPEHRTLTVRDTGIGMTHSELVENLGTVARSGTTKFMQALKEKGGDATKSGDISQIGQFGVGFYSAFLVADRVQVASKHRDSPEQLLWVSTNGASEFQIYPDPRGTTMVRGTEITLFLKEDAVEYVDPNRLEGLTKHYSEFIMHPIHLRTIKTVEVEIEEEKEEKMEDEENLEVKEDDDDEEKEKPKRTEEVTTFEWSVMNGNPAIWTRPKEEITDDEYKAFFKVVSHEEYSDVASWSHFNAEGNINFKSILYLPADIPESYKFGNTVDTTLGLNLYVRKVLISDQYELLPKYLSFIRGVVDSDDLPLNVNRETLQDSKIIQVIKKKAVRKAIEMIRNFMKTSEDEVAKANEPKLDEDGNEIPDADNDKKVVNKYLKWYESFSPSLKMGAMEDEPNRAKLLKLLRYKTSKSGDEWVSLEQYVENMKDWQKEIYYMAAINMDAVKSSPFLEQFLAKGVEVIFSTDPVDEYMIGHVRDFNGKKIINIASESVKFKDEDDKDLVTRREKYYKDKFKPLVKWLKKLYGTSVMRVVISKRLGSAPAIASSSEYGHSANMERIMRAQAFNHGQQEHALKAMRIFEINPRHPLVIKLQEGCPPEDADDSFVVAEEVIDSAWLLHEMALLGGGFPLSDPDGHAKRIIKFIQSSLKVESLQLEPELDLPALEEVAPEVEDVGSKGTSMEDAIPLDLDDLDLANFEL